MCTKMLSQYGMMCCPGRIIEYKLLSTTNFVPMKILPIANDFYYTFPESISSPFLEITFFDISGRLYCI